MSKFFWSLLTWFVLANCSVKAATSGESCTTPNGESATCISVYSCNVLYDVVTTKDPNIVRFLRASQCGYDEAPLVCCGTSASYTTPKPTVVVTEPTSVNRDNLRLLPDRNTCGYQMSEDKVLNGETAGLDEFPWMALLRYRNSRGIENFGCGGILISPRYVLTAAHCVKGAVEVRFGQLVTVRLGEWNTETDPDCVQRFCSDPPINLDVEEVIPHPDYNDNTINRYHDIALVRLRNEVKYSNYIRPVCLPTEGEKANVGELLQVVGWGRTESARYSPTKQKLGIPVVSLSDCAATFIKSGVTVRDTQLCAGGVKDKDSCTGDSGGPLLHTIGKDGAQYYVEGIVSFGAQCGREGWPGVYTKVSQYIPWIVNTLKQ